MTAPLFEKAVTILFTEIQITAKYQQFRVTPTLRKVYVVRYVKTSEFLIFWLHNTFNLIILSHNSQPAHRCKPDSGRPRHRQYVLRQASIYPLSHMA
jgi:hypothetical protein